MLLSILLTEYSIMFPAEQLFFLFIALRLMQNPIGWCCDWLKIPELARGILSQSQYQWLVRAILHQAQGVFPVFVFLAKTRVSWCPIIYMVFSFHWVTRPRATCGTLLFLWEQTLYSHLAQGAVHYLATTWVVTIRCKISCNRWATPFAQDAVHCRPVQRSSPSAIPETKESPP